MLILLLLPYVFIMFVCPIRMTASESTNKLLQRIILLQIAGKQSQPLRSYHFRQLSGLLCC